MRCASKPGRQHQHIGRPELSGPRDDTIRRDPLDRIRHQIDIVPGQHFVPVIVPQHPLAVRRIRRHHLLPATLRRRSPDRGYTRSRFPGISGSSRSAIDPACSSPDRHATMGAVHPTTPTATGTGTTSHRTGSASAPRFSLLQPADGNWRYTPPNAPIAERSSDAQPMERSTVPPASPTPRCRSSQRSYRSDRPSDPTARYEISLRRIPPTQESAELRAGSIGQPQ